jgi:osmotically-inducible protein OsmY
MNTSFKTFTTTACALAAAVALGACQRTDEGQTAGQKVDGAVANAEQKADEIRAEVKQEAREAKQEAKQATATAGDQVKDMSITTAVNAEFARDSELSALRINVDTTEGKVILRGTAPNEASRDRATTLAQRVDGVLAVDNQLSVGA